MRRLALLLAGGALWILFSAAPVFADGGPHQLAINSGTSGLSGDCAACHRAHTAKAADLLKAALPGLCLTCHNGTGATVDVVDGWQYVPDGSGDPTATVLGALRGGGFSYALIDAGNAARLSYNSRGGITVTFGTAPTSGTLTLTWPAFGSFGGDTFDIAWNSTTTTLQSQANTVFGTSAAYSGSTSVAYMSGLPVGDANMVVSRSGNVVTFAPHNSFRTVEVKVPTVELGDNGTDSPVVNIANGISVGNASKVGVMATDNKEAVTSTHQGVGTVWGNGPQGSDTAGATGVTLNCTSCHNPHGNGQYRILQTEPGEDWSVTSTATTLNGAITAGATTITVASATGFPNVPFAVKIESEQLQVTAGFGTTTWTVTRAFNGTTPAAHADTTAVTLLWSAPTTEVEVVDGATLTAGQVRNYTVKPGALTTDVIASPTAGDYFRYKFDPSGTTNFTNFYLVQDPMTTGWNGTTPTNAEAVGEASTTLTAAMTLTATTATVASTAGFPTFSPSAAPQPIALVRVDSELMTVTAVNSGTELKVTRGYFGTTVATHSIGATLEVLTKDNSTAAELGLYNKLGRMTAWCITCHTRYNGSRVTTPNYGTPSLNLQTPSDDVFMYKHGTTGTGCILCHVQHGSNAAMTKQFSSSYLFPDGTAEDSALLKVDNRGTCNLCHDPTGTVKAGTTVGTVPGAITPGP